MSKGVKIAIGIVAAIAIPFVAPVIAGAIGGFVGAGTALGGFLGGAGGSALIGAGLGAASSAATGQNPLLGAALGGVGGFAGGGGFSGLFGGGTAAGAGAAASAPAPVVGAGALAPVPAVAAAGAPLQLAGAAATAAPAAGISLSSLGSSLAAGINPSNIAQLAATMYNVSNYNDLSAERKAAVQEAAQAAATNQELFKQRVEAARRVSQLATPNPEQAFAQTEMGVQRRLAEVQRGAPLERQQEAGRRASIEGTRLGVFAANQENARANQAAATAAGMLPTQAPGGPAMASYLGAAADIRDRAQLAMQGANLVTRMFPNEQDRRPAGLFTTSMFG